MSLDVSLSQTVNTSCPHCGSDMTEDDFVFNANITHNLGKMAKEAGIYKHLWRPEELGLYKAKDLLPALNNGLKSMEDRPEHYRQFNSDNGWGTYDDFLPWVQRYLKACMQYPEAEIHVSR